MHPIFDENWLALMEHDTFGMVSIDPILRKTHVKSVYSSFEEKSLDLMLHNN